MRIAVLAAVGLSIILGCSGGMEVELGPDDPHPLLALPATFGPTPIPAEPVLKAGKKVCKGGPTSFTWKPDLFFETATPKAKFAGTWRFVDDEIVYVTRGPMGPDPRCTAPRFLQAGGVEALLCAQGPVGCGSDIRWAVEVVDDGAGAVATALVARALARIDAEVHGPGVVYSPGEAIASNTGYTRVKYRAPIGGGREVQRLAEDVVRLIERDLRTDGTELVPSPEISSPILVMVDGVIKE